MVETGRDDDQREGVVTLGPGARGGRRRDRRGTGLGGHQEQKGQSSRSAHVVPPLDDRRQIAVPERFDQLEKYLLRQPASSVRPRPRNGSAQPSPMPSAAGSVFAGR